MTIPKDRSENMIGSTIQTAARDTTAETVGGPGGASSAQPGASNTSGGTIVFDDIHRGYERGVDVLRGVTFATAPGEVVGLLGKNGAGKTTLIRVAMGLIAPQTGSVRIRGLDPRVHPVEVKRQVGYVAEDQILPPFLKVRELMDLYRELYPSWDEKLATGLRDRFGLPSGAKIGRLSKGQARQAALLCAVSHRPRILILDEPAGGLDPAARREFLETSIQLLNEAGSTILFSSHYMNDVERMAARVVLLHDGRILIDRPLDDLRENHAVALIPRDTPVDRQRILQLEGCLGLRERPEAIHAVFGCDPGTAQSMLARELDLASVHCRSVALEEMFIELVGGQS